MKLSIDLFTEESNVEYNTRIIRQNLRSLGMIRDVGPLRDAVRQAMNKVAGRWSFDCHPNSEDTTIILDYYNSEFVKLFMSLVDVPMSNPFRVEGKELAQYDLYDYRSMDLQQQHPQFSVERKTNKGIYQPHIIGAHRRAYDRDNTEGLRMTNDKGPERNWGYVNDRFYRTSVYYCKK